MCGQYLWALCILRTVINPSCFWMVTKFAEKERKRKKIDMVEWRLETEGELLLFVSFSDFTGTGSYIHLLSDLAFFASINTMCSDCMHLFTPVPFKTKKYQCLQYPLDMNRVYAMQLPSHFSHSFSPCRSSTVDDRQRSKSETLLRQKIE